MRILIVEDQIDKYNEISTLLTEKLHEVVEFTHKQSLRSGLSAVVNDCGHDILLLDMSMPSFDPSVTNPEGSKPKSFAGKELMAQMSIREIEIPTIVITQYSNFEGGSIDLPELTEDLESRFPSFFIGSVFYSSVSNEWKAQLLSLIEKLRT